MRTWLAALLALVASSATFGSDWPQWRGPHRDCAIPAEQLPDPWPAQPPPPAWRVAVGTGYGGPVVTGGRVYVLARQGGDEVCHCLDAATGKPLWRFADAVPYTPPIPDVGDWPKSTPLVADGSVFICGITGRLRCLDAQTGAVVWKRDLAADYLGRVRNDEGHDLWAPVCGFAASPLAEGDRVILPVGGELAGTFAGFDRRTGKLVWKALTDRASYASPIVAELAGVRQLVSFTGTRMAGVDLADGRLLWDYPYSANQDQTIVTPVVLGDLVIFGGERRSAIALRVSHDGSKWAAAVAWKNDDLRCDLASPVVCGGLVVGHNVVRRQLVGVDPRTGKTAWTRPRFGGYVSFAAAGGRLLALTEDGELVAIRPTPQRCEELARWKLAEGPVWAHLAVADGRVFIKDKDHLTCYDLAPGR